MQDHVLCWVMFGLTDCHRTCLTIAQISTLDGKQSISVEVGIGGAMPPAAMELPAGDGWVKDAPDIWRQMRGEEFCIRPIEPGWYGTMRRVQLIGIFTMTLTERAFRGYVLYSRSP